MGTAAQPASALIITIARPRMNERCLFINYALRSAPIGGAENPLTSNKILEKLTTAPWAVKETADRMAALHNGGMHDGGHLDFVLLPSWLCCRHGPVDRARRRRGGGHAGAAAHGAGRIAGGRSGGERHPGRGPALCEPRRSPRLCRPCARQSTRFGNMAAPLKHFLDN